MASNLLTMPVDRSDAAAGPGYRCYYLKVVLAFGLLSGFLLSPKLWLSDRAYPLSPVVDWWPNLPAPLDRWWFGALLALLVGMVVAPRSRWPIALFLAMAVFLSLGDQSRWQPWFYQYLFMLAAFVACDFRRQDAAENPSQAILNVGRIILAATYIWSGMQKLNYTFVTFVHPWLVEPLVPESARGLANLAAWVVPFFEAGVGLGLLVPVLRDVALLLVLAMHAVLLYCLGPLGHNWNSVVWPWNFAMMLLAVILFWHTRQVSLREIVWPGRSAFRWLVLLLFGVMPAFSFLGLWDLYLSAALYSGNDLQAEVEINQATYERLPEVARRCCELHDDGYRLAPNNWSLAELNVPNYPAHRVFRRIAGSLCPPHGEPGDVVLVIYERPDWLSGVRQVVREDCSTLHGAVRDRHHLHKGPHVGFLRLPGGRKNRRLAWLPTAVNVCLKWPNDVGPIGSSTTCAAE